MTARTCYLALVIAAVAGGCSSRVAYEQSPIVPTRDAININTADVDDLERLPGVGRKTAEAIVAHRLENGPFRRVEHLMLIRGISEQRFAEFRPLIRVE
ncbi:MAG: helix-hairpin-helix domain-containing protein [Chloracidobacterium sp.]|nr:helix-hairpin-helix domain-containing protein [Chloracidobacterium sp.]